MAGSEDIKWINRTATVRPDSKEGCFDVPLKGACLRRRTFLGWVDAVVCWTRLYWHCWLLEGTASVPSDLSQFD